MNIVILDEAEHDLIEGFRFYESQERGLGDYFLDSVMADIDSLRLYAGIHVVLFGKHRLLCKRFPFSVYYAVEHSEIRVFAVLDQRSDPNRHRQRLA